MLRLLELECLSQCQTDCYNMILVKEAKESLFDIGSANRDEYVTIEGRKKGADKSFQLDRIMEFGRPSTTKQVKNLHGTQYIKVKGYFEEENLDIGERNNCEKVNIPCLTVFGINKRKKIWTMRRLSHSSTLRF